MIDSVKIMPLGDSITQGFGDGNAEHYYQGYRGFLFQLLIGAGYSVDFVGSRYSGGPQHGQHEGHSGQKAGFIRDHVFDWLTISPADIVLLHIGTNDIIQLPHPHNMTNINGIVSDISGILDEIARYEKASSSKITVILARIINRADSPDPTHATINHPRVSQDPRKATTKLNEAIQVMADGRIARGDRLLVADFEHALSYPSDICVNCSPEPVHPNSGGYAKMANVWLDALRRVIRDRFTPDDAFTLDILTGLAVNHNGILEMTSVVDLEHWKPLTPISDGLFSPGAPVAMAKQNDGVLTALAVDKSGRLQVTSVGGAGIWQSPVAITKAIFKDGAPVAMAKQTDGILTALAVNTDGFLMVTSVAGLGKWDPPQTVGAAVFPSGAYIAMAKQTNGILTAVAVDKFHRLVVASVPGVGQWQAPVGIGTNHDIFLPGCPVAMAKQTDGILTALAVNQNGLLMVTSVAGIGTWDEPAGIGDPVFLPWTHVAMAKQTDGVLTAVAVDKDGRLNVTSVAGLGQWQKPVAISDADFLPGCPVALSKQTSGVLTAIAVDKHGHLVVGSVPGLGHWQKPVGITSPVFAQGTHVALAKQIDGVGLKAFLAAQPKFSGSPITRRIGQLTGWGTDPEYIDFSPFGLPVLNNTRSHGVPGVDLGANTEWQNKLVFFFGDVFANDNPDWVAFHTGSTDPWFGFPLTSVDSGSTYSPFTIKGIGSLGNAQTPTGAFSYPGEGSEGHLEQAFVFAYCNIPNTGFGSLLVKSKDPTQPTDFNQVFPFSTFAPDSRRFFQVAPLVIDNSKFPNSFPSNQGDGLVMMGHGGPTNSVHTAWMPLSKGDDPDCCTIRFFSGNPSTPAWSREEKDATTLFSTVGQTSLSLAWLPGAQRWLLLYTLASPGAVPLNIDPRAPMQHNPNGPVVARLGVTPWDWSDEIIIFDPLRDNALSRFMHRPGDKLNDKNLPDVQPVLPVDYDTAYGGNASFGYGAYLINRYTRWDPIGRNLTIYYLLSTGRPYQVQLMTSHFEIPSIGRRRGAHQN